MTFTEYTRLAIAGRRFMGLGPAAIPLAFPLLRELEVHQPGRQVGCKRHRQQQPGRRGRRHQLELRYVVPEFPERRQERPFSLFVRNPLTRAERLYRSESDFVLAQYEHLRPRVAPDDCRPGMPGAMRPCPWASCRYHLAVSVNEAGSVKIEHGHTDFEKLEETCAIDVAEQGKQSAERVGKLMGISVWRVTQAEMEMRAQITRKMRAMADGWTDDPEVPGRQYCTSCRGSAETPSGAECVNCDGEGYRWVDIKAKAAAEDDEQDAEPTPTAERVAPASSDGPRRSAKLRVITEEDEN